MLIAPLVARAQYVRDDRPYNFVFADPPELTPISGGKTLFAKEVGGTSITVVGDPTQTRCPFVVAVGGVPVASDPKWIGCPSEYRLSPGEPTVLLLATKLNADGNEGVEVVVLDRASRSSGAQTYVLNREFDPLPLVTLDTLVLARPRHGTFILSFPGSERLVYSNGSLHPEGRSSAPLYQASSSESARRDEAIPADVAAVPPVRTTLSALYRKVRQAPKSDYETTDAFTNRTSRVSPTRYAVSVAKRCSGNLAWGARYIADSSVVSVSVLAYPFYGEQVEGKGSDIEMTGPTAVLAECAQTDGGTYVGTNAFGVSKTITKASFVMFGLSVPDSDFDSLEGASMLRIRRGFIPATPSEAKALLPRLAVVAVFTVRAESGAGPTARFIGGNSPTIDNPTDQTQDMRLVRVGDYRFEIRDRTTGRVLGQILPQTH